MELSVILPAFNEGKVIKKNCAAIQAHLQRLGITYEMIIVNDGSQDNTLLEAQAIEGKDVKVISYAQNRGKGYAVGTGMKQACGKYRLFMDVDLSTSLNEIEVFLARLKQGDVDIVIATRRKLNNISSVPQPFYRRCLGAGFIFISHICISPNFSDFTCGFKMLSAQACDIVFPRQRIFNWSFDAELICIALCHHLTIEEISVKWNHQGDSKVRVLREVFTSLAGLLKIRWNAMRGLYL